MVIIRQFTGTRMEHNESATILVVDDSKFNRAIIEKTLLEINMTIVTAVNGEDALDKIDAHSFDLIITDSIMPKMDGLSLIKEIKQTKNNDFIPIILMTGNDDQNIKVSCLNIGADDFLSKPIDQKELVARVFSLLRLKKAHDLLFEKNRIIELELEVAKKIQQRIIPETFSHIGYPRITGFYLPLEDIGGDFFDCYSFADGRKGFLISDVTGHGIPAALIVMMIKMLFSVNAERFLSTKELFNHVNRELCKILMNDQYVTSFYCLYDPTSGKMHFSNAGHVLPLFYKKAKDKIYSLNTNKGYFLGIFDLCDYDQKAIYIEKGDRLFLYTDGLTEIKNRNNEEFGEEGLKRFILKNKSLQGSPFCTLLHNAVTRYSLKKPISDDIAFLYIEF